MLLEMTQGLQLKQSVENREWLGSREFIWSQVDIESFTLKKKPLRLSSPVVHLPPLLPTKP